MAKRKSISKKIRFEIFKRDEFACQYCGATPPAVILEVDHILAVANGGDNSDENLVTSCFNCNRGKSANPLESIPESLENKAARVQEAEEQLKQYYKILQAKKDRVEDEMWRIADILEPGSPESGFNRKKLTSIKTFLSRLVFFEVEEAAEIAAANKYEGNQRFAYFCGICWRKIRGQNGES